MSDLFENANKQKQTFLNIQHSLEEQETLENPYVHKTMEDVTHGTRDKRKELLDEKLSSVMSLMPEQYRAKTDDDLPVKRQGVDSFPPALKRAIKALSSWEKVKAISSKPVKEAAKKLSEARTDAEGAQCLGDLLSASISYLDKRVDQWHLWWGDGRKRLRQVKGFIEEAYLFSATAPACYSEKMGNCMDGFLRASVEKPERYQRHVEKAEYMRDIKRKSLLVEEDSEESVHIHAEKELTETDFEDLVHNLTTTSGTGFDGLKFGSAEEAVANKTANARILAEVQHHSREFMRGLALDYDINMNQLTTARVSLRVADYLMEHLEEAHNFDEVWERMSDEENKYRDEEVNKLNHFYGITHSFNITNDLDDMQKYFGQLNYIKDFKESDEFESYLKRIKRTADDPQIDYFISMELKNRFVNGDPRAFFTQISMDDETVEDDYFVELERRKAKGRLLAEAEASTARTAEIFSQKMKEATRENNYQDIGQTAKNLITLDLSELMENFMMQPALINSRIAEIKMVKDYMPYITANAKKCDLSPNELAKLMAITAVVDVFEEKMALEKQSYASGFIYVDERDAMDINHGSSMEKYAKSIVRNQDPLIAKEGRDLLDLRERSLNKKRKLDPVERLSREIIVKEDLIMSDGMKELETQTGFSGSELSYTPEQLEEKRQLRISHIDNMLEICRTFLKNEKSRSKKSERYRRIQSDIKTLEERRKFLTKGYNYNRGIDEIFDYEDRVIDDTLEGLRGVLLESGTKETSVVDEAEYNKRRETAALSLGELIYKCRAQLEQLPVTDANAATRQKLTDIIYKRDSQRSFLEDLDFAGYMNMYATRFFIDFREIVSVDEAKQQRMDSEQAKLKSLTTEFGKQKVQLSREASTDYDESSKKHDAYVGSRLKNSPYAARVRELEGRILSGEVVLEESMLSDMVSDIYSEMTIDDVRDQYSYSGLLSPAAIPALGLGAEDTGIVMDYVQTFFGNPEFAGQMGLKDEHMEAYNKFSAQCDEIMILTTRAYMMEHMVPHNLNIDTKDMPAEQKASIENQKKLFYTTIANMRYSANNLALQKFQHFCMEFFPFLIDNDINVTMTKEGGVKKDYMKEVREDEEKQVDISGMDEKQAALARVEYYDKSFEDKYKDYNLRTFSAVMRQKYYLEKSKDQSK